MDDLIQSSPSEVGTTISQLTSEEAEALGGDRVGHTSREGWSQDSHTSVFCAQLVEPQRPG